MPPSDLLLFTLPILLLLALPGFALLTLLAPAWSVWARAGVCVPAGIGVIALLGVAMHHLHVRFTVGPVAVALLMLVGVAGAQMWRNRALPPGEHWPGRAVAAALITGLFMEGSLVAAEAGQALTLDADGPTHALVAQTIVRGQDTAAPFAEPLDHNHVVLRASAGLEAAAAVAAESLAPLDASMQQTGATRALVPIITWTLLLFPLALLALYLAFGLAPMAAAVAVLFTLGQVTPSQPFLGGQLPLVVDNVLVVPMVVAGLEYLREGGWGRLALSALAGAMSMAIHGTEIFTVLSLAAPFVLVVLWHRRERGVSLRLGALCATAGFAVIATVRLLPLGLSTLTVGGESLQVGTVGAGDALSGVYQTVLPTPLQAVLLIAGAAICVLTRRYGALLAAHLLLVFAVVDSVSLGMAAKLWSATYPWSAFDRLLGLQVFVLPPLMAIGAVALWERGLVPRLRAFPAPRLRALAVAIVLILALSGVRTDFARYSDGISKRGVTPPEDYLAMRELSAILPSGTTVFTHGNEDSGVWLNVITDLQVPLDNTWVYQVVNDWHLVALEHACDDPQRALAALHGFAVIYMGSETVPQNGHPWSAQCIAALPGVTRLMRVAAGAGEAVALTVPPRLAAMALESSPPRR